MRQVLAFDVYGTLIDTAGVVAELRALVGDDADRFAAIWRDKQLEYSFRRGLMQRYTDFAICIRDALEYTASYLDTSLDSEARESLLETYRELPPFADVGESVEKLAAGPFELYAFSNGRAATVDGLLTAAGIRAYFRDIVSVEEVGSFKPDPRVYRHFLARAAVEARSAWLVSGNPFDVLGAMAVGMQGIWVRRSATALFDPWGVEPSLTVAELGQIGAGIAGQLGLARS